MHQIETKHSTNVAESTALPSGLGMNRPAQRFRSKSVSVERASRNTHLHEQVGASKWAIQDSQPRDGFAVPRHWKINLNLHDYAKKVWVRFYDEHNIQTSSQSTS